MKLLFSVIGDPDNYREVTYLMENCNQGKKSKTSFTVIKECLNVDKTIVIAGVSLSKKDCNNYEECSEYALNYVKEKGINADKIIIAPNIYGKFKGNTQSFFSYVYIHALMEMQNVDEVILDTTHGINYMPLVAKDAITLAIATYVTSESVKSEKEKKVKFTIYNSDPIIKDNQGPYNLNVVSETIFTQLSGVKYITLQLMNHPSFDQIMNNKEFKKIMNKEGIKDIAKSVNIRKLAKALDNGIFLYLVEKSETVKQLLPSLCDELMNVEINKKDSIYELQGSSVIISLIHSLIYVISSFQKKEITLNDLRTYADLLTDEVTGTIILNEINEIEKEKDKIDSEKKLFIERFKPKGFDKRILYAHGGLPAAGTYVWKESEKVKEDNETKESEKIYVSYGDKIDEIESHL